MSKNIAIIGAGISGLTAAYWLNKFGYTVTVYESSNRVGGRMSTDTIKDCIIDRGAQFLSSDYSTLMPLIRELNMQDELVEASEWTGVVRDHKIRNISANHVLTPITSGYINILDALRFLYKLRHWGTRISTLPLDDYAAWANFDDESAADFIQKEFGSSILEYLIEPQMQGFHYQSPEETSKIHALMLLSFMFKKGKVLSLRNGMSTLPEKLASGLNIKLNCQISSIDTRFANKVLIQSDGAQFHADKVILAIPAPLAYQLFNNPTSIEHALLQTQYNPTINISIATDNDWNLPAKLKNLYGILIPRNERLNISGIGIESNKSTNRVQEGELFNVMLDSIRGSDLLNKPDEMITNSIIAELAKYFPRIEKSVRLAHVIRWKYAEPVSSIGRSKNIKNYRKYINSSNNIILAGDYMGFPYTDSASFTGKWAAEYIRSTDT